jgi:RHS repeat-associated protein
VVRGYEYDPAGRLRAVTVDGTVVASYERDENGNLLSATAGGATVSGAYDAQDRVTAWGATTYAHRADGTRSAKREGADITTYDYDELGSLLAVVLPGGRRIDYVVDARGRRVGKQVDGKLVQGFLYGDRMRVVAELDGAGAVVSRFVYGTRAHVPDYMVRGGATYRIVSDHLGSPRLVVDAATGVVAQELEYDALGAVVRDTSPGFQPFGFAGGLRDLDTGLVRLGARDYDPALGRWTAKDPLLLFGGAVNLYAYAGGDPVNGLDATGLVTDPCDPPDDRCGGSGGDGDGGDGDRRPRRSWEDRIPFNIPNGVDSVVEWVGAVASLLSGTVHFVESAASLNALGSAGGLLAWPIAFEDALQTGDQLADRYVTDRLRRQDERWEDLAEEVERGADGDGCP